MLSCAPELVALGCRMDELSQRRQDLRTLVDLARKFHLAEKFSELSTYIESLLAQADSEYFAQLQTAPALATPPASKEDVAMIIEPLKVKQDVALTSLTDTNKIVKRINNREKKAQRRKKQQYTLDRLNAIHAQWLVAKQDPNVISISSHKADYDAALKYYKKEFNALGVHTGNDLRKALKAWSQRTSRVK